ncbi:polysaccharide biosynthesis/export family protein [Flavobacterium macacae]|uniref:polysaccharide biosynthesis/export family protein n=1 Tax=Flavobacterium macacae TaxID=2488993 RepID=UPI0026797D5F|nr:polysaccharide biosynthesis/export family protein [Flavobacterium macacae]
MNKALLIFVLLAGIFFTSCVPTQDLIYLQDKNNSGAVPAIHPVVAKPYRIQINDVLSIKLKALDPSLVAMFNAGDTGAAGETEQSLYFSGYTVDDHGNIRMPVLGEMNVLGFTLEEIRLMIEKQLLDDYFHKEANIFVTLKLSGLRYTVNGEIGSPGSKVLFQEKANVMEAIANSGDITITGDRKNVMIIRQFPHGTENALP